MNSTNLKPYPHYNPQLKPLPKPRPKLEQVIQLFNELFAEPAQNDLESLTARRDLAPTRLIGGFPEPFYRSPKNGREAEICFTHDYLNSCLHEVAHWCMAGALRRGQDDYGYWYWPDGRDTEKQKEFFKVEAAPQALEWAFAKACDSEFRISCDNLSDIPDKEISEREFSEKEFSRQLENRLQDFLDKGFPPRAQKWIDCLMENFHPEVSVQNRLAWLTEKTLGI